MAQRTTAAAKGVKRLIAESSQRITMGGQQNAAMVEEVAVTASSLAQQVQSVRQSMRLFRLKSGEATLDQMDAVGLRREHKQQIPQ